VATRILFVNGQEITVPQSPDDVVLAVRRDDPNPVKLEAPGGRLLHVNWRHVVMIEEQP
jgi:hypothetical protein